ncbi:MAG TPA: chemotaxis protein CheW [Rectinemataceae bacterium]|nr:chemotaxis protein CheW [Rectinemataceae bacterium]
MTVDRDRQYIRFTLGEGGYALPASSVLAVQETPSITRLHRAEKYVVGHMEHFGAAIPVIDLRVWLELPFCGAGSERCALILSRARGDEAVLIAALADSVQELVELCPSAIERGDTLTQYGELRALTGMARCGGEYVAVLDPSFIFSSIGA